MAKKQKNTLLKKSGANRKVKDRLFCYIFEQDRKALLQLYNALNGTDYQDEQALQIVTLKDVVYMAMHNDVAFILAGTLNLYEHQSTVCPNMPLRFLLYLAAELEAIVESMDANIYGNKLIKLPAPQCIVFYNGQENMQEEQFLHLTDAFSDKMENHRKSCMELTVRVLNINYGHNPELMAYCKRLDEYSFFIETIRNYQRKGHSMDEAIDCAVDYCIDQNVMADILIPFRAEVKKMLLTGYTEERVRKLFERDARESGFQDGYQDGMACGLKQGLEQGLEQGLQQGTEQGLKQGLEQGLQQGLEQGLEQGLQQGTEHGIAIFIQTCEELGLSEKDISSRIKSNFSLTEENARKYMALFSRASSKVFE